MSQGTLIGKYLKYFTKLVQNQLFVNMFLFKIDYTPRKLGSPYRNLGNKATFFIKFNYAVFSFTLDLCEKVRENC